jgi:hypothetical protein
VFGLSGRLPEQEAKDRDDEKREQEAREFLRRESERVQREREARGSLKNGGPICWDPIGPTKASSKSCKLQSLRWFMRP